MNQQPHLQAASAVQFKLDTKICKIVTLSELGKHDTFATSTLQCKLDITNQHNCYAESKLENHDKLRVSCGLMLSNSNSPCVTKSKFSSGYLSARALITLAYLVLAALTDSPHLGTCSEKI
jgi:hypothetical protein